LNFFQPSLPLRRQADFCGAVTFVLIVIVFCETGESWAASFLHGDRSCVTPVSSQRRGYLFSNLGCCSWKLWRGRHQWGEFLSGFRDRDAGRGRAGALQTKKQILWLLAERKPLWKRHPCVLCKITGGQGTSGAGPRFSSPSLEPSLRLIARRHGGER